MRQDTATVQPDARKNDDPYELAYYHYSVYMNKRRRTAWFSAANVDGDQRRPSASAKGIAGIWTRASTDRNSSDRRRTSMASTAAI